MPQIVRIETRRNRQCEDLPCMWVLHYHYAMLCLRLLHLMIQSTLCHVLNIHVDGENQIFTRQWLALLAASCVALRIQRCQHVTGSSMQIVVERTLQPAQPGIVRTYVTEY